MADQVGELSGHPFGRALCILVLICYLLSYWTCYVYVFRFCHNSTLADRRQKLQVNVNVKDIFAKKKTTNVTWVWMFDNASLCLPTFSRRSTKTVTRSEDDWGLQSMYFAVTAYSLALSSPIVWGKFCFRKSHCRCRRRFFHALNIYCDTKPSIVWIILLGNISMICAHMRARGIFLLPLFFTHERFCSSHCDRRIGVGHVLFSPDAIQSIKMWTQSNPVRIFTTLSQSRASAHAFCAPL